MCCTISAKTRGSALAPKRDTHTSCYSLPSGLRFTSTTRLVTKQNPNFQPSKCQTCWLQICHTSGLLIQLLLTLGHTHTPHTYPLGMSCLLQSHVNKLVLGGEFCLWTDMWARNYQCFDQPKEQWPDDRWAPVAYWMSDTSKDDVFMDSAAGMVSIANGSVRACARACACVYISVLPSPVSFVF